MSRVQILLIFAFAIIFTASATEQCPPHQEWTDCGTACPPRCNEPPRQICTLQCKIGCQCKDGYLLNGNGDCVRPKDCDNS